MKILILVGAPGSGKSTFARYFLRTEENWMRVCRDDFRLMQFSADNLGYKEEEIITGMVDDCISTLLKNKYNVLVDATHTKQKFIEHYISKFNCSASISFKIFDVGLDELKQRCEKRHLETGKYIPERVIEKFHQEMEELKSNFDFSDRPKSIRNENIEYRLQSGELPKAIVSDLDGTLALLNGRSPYDASTADEDLLNEPVADVLKNYHELGYKILLVSGRESSFEPQTRKFLEKHQIQFNELWMRKEKDFRKDAVIKKEIFEQHIENKYRVEFVLDDRNQVVDLWRKQLNLACFQVNYGDF